VPWDATANTPAKWIDNDRIRKLLKASKARHILLISDSCFAGDFFRGVGVQATPQILDGTIRKAFTRMSRKAMTSGGLEPVADGGQDGQSVYTWWLLKALEETADPYVLPEQVHDRLKKAVAANAGQTPIYGLLHEAGGEPDGSFVFFRRGSSALDAAMKKKMVRIEALKKLDEEAAEKAQRQHEEIARKQSQLQALDSRLAALRKKFGAGGAVGSEFDEMLAIARERTRRGEELEELRKKAEEDLRRKELELAEARRKQEEEQNNQLMTDLDSFRKDVHPSKFLDDDFKQQTWKALCQKWGVPESTQMGSSLTYARGKVHTGDAPLIPFAGGKKMKNTVGMELVLLPSGEFEMGSTEYGEEPVHTVKISKPFYMCSTEVTQAQYEAVMGKNPSNFKAKDLPIETVSWEDAVEFCKKLSEKEKKSYRLPTEAEWEFACRAGTKTVYYSGDNEKDLDDVAWFKDNSDRTTHPVGKKKPNAFGLYDIHGNVWEWCSDWYRHYPSKSAIDPTGPTSGVLRVGRGGGWDGSARFCRSAHRRGASPGNRDDGLGFRAVLEVQR